MAIRYFLTTIISLLALSLSAQKKVIPVTQSALTGIALPTGSKQDKRLLSEVTAQILLETESKKANTGIKNTEVLYLPSLSSSGFNADSLVNLLSAAGWEVIPIESDDKYVWLRRNGQYIIAYFFMAKKDTQLYFAESISTPVLAAGENNNSTGKQNSVDKKLVPYSQV
jgi:hypothetical protein